MPCSETRHKHSTTRTAQEGRGAVRRPALCPLSMPAMRGPGAAPCGPGRTFPPSRPRGCPSVGSGGGTHAGRLHAQDSGPRMAAHRAQLHAGAVSFLSSAPQDSPGDPGKPPGACWRPKSFPLFFPFSWRTKLYGMAQDRSEPLRRRNYTDKYVQGQIQPVKFTFCLRLPH